MTTPKFPDDRLPGEEGVTRRYRDAGREQPPPALDARILAEARRAVGASARARFGVRWAVPLSTAAVIVVSFGVVLLMSKEGALDHREAEVPVAASSPAASRPLTEPAEPGRARDAVPARREVPAPSAEGLARDAPKSAAVPATPAAAPPRAKAESKLAERARPADRAAGMLAMEEAEMSDQADVIGVRASGVPGAYQFHVTVRSPDTGCTRYADWWEVVSTDGQLLYRRVLLHSHVGEQPFTRAGGPVPVDAGTVVWVRAHMNTGGYGGVALRGSVRGGFAPAPLPADFAAPLARQAPLPDGCAF